MCSIYCLWLAAKAACVAVMNRIDVYTYLYIYTYISDIYMIIHHTGLRALWGTWFPPCGGPPCTGPPGPRAAPARAQPTRAWPARAQPTRARPTRAQAAHKGQVHGGPARKGNNLGQLPTPLRKQIRSSHMIKRSRGVLGAMRCNERFNRELLSLCICGDIAVSVVRGGSWAVPVGSPRLQRGPRRVPKDPRGQQGFLGDARDPFHKIKCDLFTSV